MREHSSILRCRIVSVSEREDSATCWEGELAITRGSTAGMR